MNDILWQRLQNQSPIQPEEPENEHEERAEDPERPGGLLSRLGIF